MTIKTLTVGAIVDDADGISTSQTPAATGVQALTITGALASGGSVTLATAQIVTLTAAANETGRVFTITGTDADGTAITDTIAGPNTTTGSTTKHFKTITDVDTDDDTAGAVTVGVLKANGGVSATTELNVNQYGDDFKYMAVFDLTGAGTFSLQGSLEDVDTEMADRTWYAFTTFSAITADAVALLVYPAKTVRLLCTASTSGTAQAQIQSRGQDFIQRTK